MNKRFIVASALLASAVLAFPGCNSMKTEGAKQDMHANMWANVTHAVAVLQPTAGNNVKGTIQFEQMGDHVHAWGEITGLAPNSTHGFHIHEFGDASSDNGSAAGGHYNPEGAAHQHGDLNGPTSHAGDMGNITADASGTAKVDIHLMGVSIAGMKDPIIGRAVVVHANKDDFTASPPSPTPGNAGARLAVGVIGVKKNP